jgi:hypothetical protein
MKTRSGDKTITKENIDKAKELLNKLGVKATMKIIVPECNPPQATPPRPKQQALVIKSPVPPKPEASTPPAAAPSTTPATAAAAPPPPLPKPTIAAAASSSIDTKEEEEASIAAGAMPLTDAMKEVLKTEPKDKYVVAGWFVGLNDNDDVLDYLQEVITYK